MDQINLRKHDQVVDIYPAEADALCHAVRLYLQRLVYLSGYRQIYRQELLSIKPLNVVLTKLSRMQLAWPRDKNRRPRVRKWKVEAEQLVLLNRLMVDEELFPVQTQHANYFNTIYGRINQKALNLTQFFEL